MPLNLLNIDGSSVASPVSGKTAVFADASGVLSTKTPDGTVTPIGASSGPSTSSDNTWTGTNTWQNSGNLFENNTNFHGNSIGTMMTWHTDNGPSLIQVDNHTGDFPNTDTSALYYLFNFITEDGPVGAASHELRAAENWGSGEGRGAYFRWQANKVNFTTGVDTVIQMRNGNLEIMSEGGGLRVAEGTNAKQGIATLVGGTVTVSNSRVTANSRIFLTTQADGGTPGFVRVSARTVGTSFTITSSDAGDTSVVAYEIFEPAS